MTLFTLKLIALVTMTIDHVGRFFFPNDIEWLLIGRLAFPIFAWGIANGYHHTSNLKKYMTRLGMFALISQIPFTLAYVVLLYTPTVLNIFFTLLLGLCAIALYDRIPHKGLGALVVLLLSLVASIMPTDYGAYGVLLTFVFYLTYGKPKLMIQYQTALWALLFFLGIVALATPLKSMALTFLIPQTLAVQFVALLSVGLIALYTGVQGPRMKWLFYWYYPLHLLVLVYIATIIS